MNTLLALRKYAGSVETIGLKINAEKKLIAVTSAGDRSCGMSLKLKFADKWLKDIRACFSAKFLGSLLPGDADTKFGISDVRGRYAFYIKETGKLTLFTLNRSSTLLDLTRRSPCGALKFYALLD